MENLKVQNEKLLSREEGKESETQDLGKREKWQRH